MIYFEIAATSISSSVFLYLGQPDWRQIIFREILGELDP